MDEMILTPAEKMERVVERLTRERDEAREKLASLDADYAEAHDIAVSESVGRRVAEAEVKRLEGLILAWEGYQEGCHSDLLAEARRICAQRERCPYCAFPIGDGTDGTCTSECHGKGDSCRCAQREGGGVMDPLHEHMKHGCCAKVEKLREENARLTRERDEAREKLASLDADYAEAHDIAVSESVGRRSAEAEVARLEGLILAWEGYQEGCHSDLLAEARRIRAQREEGR